MSESGDRHQDDRTRDAATGLLETTAVGHSLRDLVRDQDNAAVHKAPVTGIDLDSREVRFDGLPSNTYDLPRRRPGKAVVDWAGSELTHQRVGRITVDE